MKGKRTSETGAILLLEMMVAACILLLLIGPFLVNAMRLQGVNYEVNALHVVRAVSGAESYYISRWQPLYLTPSYLSNLAAGAIGTPATLSCSTPMLLSPDVTGVINSSAGVNYIGNYKYTFTITGASSGTCTGVTGGTGWTLTAIPQQMSPETPRAFFADQSGAVRWSAGNTVPNASSAVVTW